MAHRRRRQRAHRDAGQSADVAAQSELAREGRAPGLKLRLYVAAGAPNSTLAEANLAALLEAHGAANAELEIIDCIRDPKRALRDGVLVTPTLLRVSPTPQQTIVGTLSDSRRVAAALGLPVDPHGARASA